MLAKFIHQSISNIFCALVYVVYFSVYLLFYMHALLYDFLHFAYCYMLHDISNIMLNTFILIHTVAVDSYMLNKSLSLESNIVFCGLYCE